MRCGSCGSSYVVCSAHRLACAGARERGICSNRLTIRRDEVERRVLAALQTRFFEGDAFQVFCEEFRVALNDARMEARAAATAGVRERETLVRQIENIVQAIMDGAASPALRQRLETLEARAAALDAQSATAVAAPPLLHPNMAERWRVEIAELRAALTDDRCDVEAREAVRNMVEEIRLTPKDGVLAIEVKGNLASMLHAANPSENWQRQMTLVAGAGFEPATFGL
jgi:site-specific DNA recombinase